jgi:hypothetical protein
MALLRMRPWSLYYPTGSTHSTDLRLVVGRELFEMLRLLGECYA